MALEVFQYKEKLTSTKMNKMVSAINTLEQGVPQADCSAAVVAYMNVHASEFVGPQGVSITSIVQTTKSTEDEGINIVTVTLSNGNTYTFEVKNGSKGSKGDKGADGIMADLSTADGKQYVRVFKSGHETPEWEEVTIAGDADDITYTEKETHTAGSVGAALAGKAPSSHTHNAGEVSYNSSATYGDGTIGKSLTQIALKVGGNGATTNQVLTKLSNGTTGWANQQGGGGEPDSYIKDASVSGNTLTLTKKDDSTVAFTPTGGGGGGGNASITYNSDGSATITDGATEKKFLPMELVAKYGVVSQTITYKTGGTHICSNLVYGYIPMASINQWVAAGSLFNDTANAIERTAPWGDKVMHLPGYFYLNGLGDISAEEMERVYSKSNKLVKQENVFGYYNARIRTNLSDLRGYDGVFGNVSLGACTNNMSYMFAGSYSVMEVISVGYEDNNNSLRFHYPITTTNIFYTNNMASRIVGILTKDFINSNTQINSMLNLRSFRVARLDVNADLSGLSKLDTPSILYLIQNAVNGTTDITITLHHDAYMRAIADTDIQAALEINGHITLACATHADEKYPA